MSKKSSSVSLYNRCLNGIERVGNSLPHPIVLFAIGTITATMLPYSVTFLVCWTVMLIIWLALGLPIGVATPLFYPA